MYRNDDNISDTMASEESIIVKSGELIRPVDLIFYYHEVFEERQKSEQLCWGLTPRQRYCTWIMRCFATKSLHY